MGIVYKARQISLNRIVAIKMILAGQRASEHDIQRFHAEAESAANLNHPGIVSVHEVGMHADQHYLCMAFVDGPSLAAKLANGPLPPREAADLMKQVAEATAYAHAQGIIHRDLKPGNILLDRRGKPLIADFGLAKRIGQESGLTATGQILGTPSYMPPEQATGRHDGIDEKSDVYSLGAILYALITGRPPFNADNQLDTVIQVLEQEPAPPRLLNPKLDDDLETICLKYLEKNPDHRYQSAGELAADLGRYLEGESISVRSLNILDRVARTLQRSTHDVELRAWGSMLLWFAGIVFLAEVGIYLHALDGPPYPTHWAILIRASQYASMLFVLWAYRRRWSVSQTGATRQMWAIWIGYLVACHVVLISAYQMASADYPMDELRVYPVLAILSGLIFFVMGGSYWGHCFSFGAIFFVLAVLMPVNLRWSPLEFGLLWAVCLTLIGNRLRGLAKSKGQGFRFEVSGSNSVSRKQMNSTIAGRCRLSPRRLVRGPSTRRRQ